MATQENSHKEPKKTVLYRYELAKKAKDFDMNNFCGVILAEHIESAKDCIDRIGKLWNKKDVPFPMSEKAFDHIQTVLYEHIENMVSQLKAGNKKVIKGLEPVEF